MPNILIKDGDLDGDDFDNDNIKDKKRQQHRKSGNRIKKICIHVFIVILVFNIDALICTPREALMFFRV